MTQSLLRIWNSPTFTTWGNLAAESLRLVIITPLLLTRFDQTEIAAWYLYSSLLIFGTIVSGRISLTFSRMIAFAMAGAADLSPVMGGERRGNGEPNWNMVKRVYSTVGALNLATAVITALSAAAMGAFALDEMVAGYAQPEKIWIALGVMVGTQSVITGFSHYEIVLKGMNFVALTNRWGVLFSLLSTVAGVVALSLGADIVWLAVTMQSVQALNIIRMRLLLSWVNDGRFRGCRCVNLDREILSWAWPPFWKGLCSSFASSGVLQLGSIVYTRHAAVGEAASYLFSLRILQAVARFCEAPLLSHGPRMSRLLAAGNIGELRALVCRKATESQILLATACIMIGVLGPTLTFQIGSNAEFLQPHLWAVLTILFIAHRYLLVGLRLPAMSNQILCFRREIAAALISALVLLLLVPHFGAIATIAAVFLPPLILINVRPFAVSAVMLELPLAHFVARTAGWSVVIYAVLAGIISIVPNI